MTKLYTILIALAIIGTAVYCFGREPEMGAEIEPVNIQTEYDKSAITNKYDLIDKKLITKIAHKDDTKIEVSTDKPDMRISKWDNEVSFKVKPRTGTLNTFAIDGEKIKWTEDTREYHLYEIEDGYEVEVILLEKPASNIVEMDIETVGLNFYYQPALHPDHPTYDERTWNEERQDWDYNSFRPENVVGSYAVYHSTKKDYITGQKNYIAGKAFHIYRPLIIDANNKEVWGELNIDVENKLLSVKIPQEFLDNAVYPVRHAAGLTFGDITEGSSRSSMNSIMKGSVFTMGGVTGTASSISVYTVDEMYYQGMGNEFDTQAAIYLHSSSGLITNGATNAATGGAVPEWVHPAFGTDPTVVASTDYVLVANGSIGGGGSSDPQIYYDSGDTNQGHYETRTYGSFPATASFTHDNNIYSIYCTYIAEEEEEEEAPTPAQIIIFD